MEPVPSNNSHITYRVHGILIKHTACVFILPWHEHCVSVDCARYPFLGLASANCKQGCHCCWQKTSEQVGSTWYYHSDPTSNGGNRTRTLPEARQLAQQAQQKQKLAAVPTKFAGQKNPDYQRASLANYKKHKSDTGFAHKSPLLYVLRQWFSRACNCSSCTRVHVC